jgi:hypothetical protein
MGVLIGDHCHLLVSIVLEYPAQKGGPFIPREAYIDVWRIMSTRIEEPFKKHIVPNGVHVRNPKTVRHAGSSCSPSATSPGAWRTISISIRARTT